VPRQIIDTTSSRPAYVRRVVGIVVLALVVLAVIVYAIVTHGLKI